MLSRGGSQSLQQVGDLSHRLLGALWRLAGGRKPSVKNRSFFLEGLISIPPAPSVSRGNRPVFQNRRANMQNGRFRPRFRSDYRLVSGPFRGANRDQNVSPIVVIIPTSSRHPPEGCRTVDFVTRTSRIEKNKVGSSTFYFLIRGERVALLDVTSLTEKIIYFLCESMRRSCSRCSTALKIKNESCRITFILFSIAIEIFIPWQNIL